MDDLWVVASVYNEVRLFLPLAMVLLKEEAQNLTFLPLCDECLREDEMNYEFQGHGVLLVVVTVCQEGRELHHLCTIHIVETIRIR